MIKIKNKQTVMNATLNLTTVKDDIMNEVMLVFSVFLKKLFTSKIEN